jgi:hypothetical protein
LSLVRSTLLKEAEKPTEYVLGLKEKFNNFMNFSVGMPQYEIVKDMLRLI